MPGLFRKKQNKFIQLIAAQADLTLQGLQALKTYMEQDDKETAERISAIEKEADEARRILVDELNQTFVTPIDREDIFALSRAIDDVIDYAYTTVDEMVLFKLKPTKHMQRIATLLCDAGQELLLAVNRLEKHKGVAIDHAQRAKALENRVETVYREALAGLFKDAEELSDLVKILKLREVLRHLSNAADRGDEAANIISDIVVKIA